MQRNVDIFGGGSAETCNKFLLFLEILKSGREEFFLHDQIFIYFKNHSFQTFLVAKTYICMHAEKNLYIFAHMSVKA